MSNAPDGRSLKLYILGSLPAEEAEALEGRYFAEGPLFDELLLAEDDLIDDYEAGRLAPIEARAFEAAFLASPRRRERLEFARALGRAAAATRARPQGRQWTGALLAAAAVIACLGVAGWVSIRLRSAEERLEASRGQLRALQSEVESLRNAATRLSQDLAAAARPAGGVMTWALGPGLNRGAGAPPPLALAEGAEWVRLRFPVGRAEPLTVAIETPEGRVVWMQPGLAGQPSTSGLTLEAMVPSRVMAPGTYLVLVKRGDGVEVGSFPLRVSAER